MLVTSDFIFVHIPKTGGTFINKIISDLYKPSLQDKFYDLFNKSEENKSCVHFMSDDEYDNLNGYSYGQHCGLRHVSKSDKPIFHVKRDIEGYYKSLFYFGWFNKYPHLDKKILEAEFSNFPNLLPEELFDYYQLVTEKIMGTQNLKFGYLTFQLVDQLATSLESRDKILNLIQENKIDDAVIKLQKENPNMHILDLNNLNDELMSFIRESTSFSERKIRSIIKHEKLNVSKKDISNNNSFLTEDQLKLEEFAIKYWDI